VAVLGTQRKIAVSLDGMVKTSVVSMGGLFGELMTVRISEGFVEFAV